MANDEKRFSITPLSYEHADRALPGEIIVDDETGNVWVKNRDTGELKCATQGVNTAVNEIVNGRFGILDYAYNNNRVVYRFYFDGNSVKLDSSLKLPAEYCYYQIRDVNRATKYYLTELTAVETVGTSIYPEDATGNVIDALHHNGTYFVEFYNINFELMTQLLFTAKKAPALDHGNKLDKMVNHIVIAANRDILYLNESINSINVRVYAVYGDGSVRDTTDFSNVSLRAAAGDVSDITDSQLTSVDLSQIDTSKEGTYTIFATFINKADNYTVLTAKKTIMVSKTEYNKLLTNGLVVVPRLYSQTANDIRLQAYGYFENGTMRDITEDVVFSYSGKLEFDENGLLDKTVLVVFNAGEGNQVMQQREVRVTLYTNNTIGAAGADTVQYNNTLDGFGVSRNILRINPNHAAPEAYTYYKVRSISKLDASGYYTSDYANYGYTTSYIDTNNEPITDGQLVIVEYYNANKVLVAAEGLTCEFVEASGM